MSHLLEPILNLPPAVAYTVIGLLVFGEAAIFLGFVLPGETAVVLGGVLASRHDLSLPWLLVLVVVAAVVGDSVGYEVGKHYGDRVLRWRLLNRHASRLDGARGYLRSKGGSAVFLGRWTAFFRAVMPGLAGMSRMPYRRFLVFNALGRWTAFFRAVMPGLAGMSRMPYRRFLVFNALGGLAWGVSFTLVGYLAGNSYAVVEKTVGRAGAVVTLAVVLVALLVWHRRRRRSEGASDGAGFAPAVQLATNGETQDPGPAGS